MSLAGRRSWRSGSSQDARTVGGSGFRDGPTRPTSSLVRGALFNMLEHRGWLAEASTSSTSTPGSGALGIEALSRGARAVVFVEASASAVRDAARTTWPRAAVAERAEVLADVAPSGRCGRSTRQRRAASTA